MNRFENAPNVPDEILFLIYRDIGQYLTKIQKTTLANKWYTRSLEVNSQNAECYYSRSVNSANAGNGKESLEDAKTALKLHPLSTQINIQEASAYIHCNAFEEAIMSLYNNKRKFNSKKLKAFDEEIEALRGIYENSLGLELASFAYSKKEILQKIGDQIRAEKSIELKPLWKKRKEQNECDVVSVQQIKEKFLHPREIERRKLAYKTFHQIYGGRNWVDIVFLNKLRNNKTLLLKQTQYSTNQIENHLNQNFKTSISFFKMLHAQDPLYHTRIKTCPNPEVAERRLQSFLYRIQYRTRREMFAIIKHVKELRNDKKLEELIHFVENVMSIYPAIKTKRVMPWKFEFLYEIFTTVGLAYCDEFSSAESLVINDSKANVYSRILRLLKVKKPIEKKNIDYVFGDKNTFQEPDAKDYGFIRYKNHIKKLEIWLRISKYSLERIFVLYQISLTHLKRGKYKDCLLFITKCKEICDREENILWKFLANLMIARAYAVQERMERNVSQLKETLKCAQPLNNLNINSILIQLNTLNSLLLKNTNRKMAQQN